MKLHCRQIPRITFQPSSRERVDGVLGSAMLGIARIELDWERQCLWSDTQ